MKLHERIYCVANDRIGRKLIIVGCLYESVALSSRGRVPTLCALTKRARSRSRAGTPLVVGLYLWLTYHVLFEKVLPAIQERV